MSRWLLSIPLLLLPAPAPSQTAPGLEVEDRIDVVRVDRRLLAVRAAGGLPEVALEIDEEVTGTRSGGLVGVATTSTRLLGISGENGGWQELRLRVGEREEAPRQVFLGDRVALVVLPHRLATLAPEAGGWNELELTPRETVLHATAGENVAVVVTRLRAIGFSGASGFATTPFRPGERIEASSIKDSSLVLTTDSRVLVFRAGSRLWVERGRFKR